MPDKKQKQSQNLSSLIINTLNIIKTQLADLILIVFIIICLTLAVLLIAIFIYYILLYKNIITLDYIFSYRLVWKVIAYVFYLLIAVIAQLLLYANLLNPTNSLKQNLIITKKYFWQFLLLNIVVNAAFAVASLPLTVTVILFVLNNFVLGLISLLLGIVLVVLVTAYLLFSSLVMVDQGGSFLTAIKTSASLARKNLGNLIFKMIVLSLIFIILNVISARLAELQYLGLFFSSVITLFLILFLFTYIFVMYRDYKNLNNA